jgi:hypothetical protein
MPTIRKRSFLLFELLVSLALVLLCLFPLIKPHASMRKAASKQMEQMQMQRVAQTAFCTLKQMLYENKEHTWGDLMHGTEGKLAELFTIFTGEKITKTLSCNYTIKQIDHSDKTKKSGLVIEIALNFTPCTNDEYLYTRTLYLERHEP